MTTFESLVYEMRKAQKRNYIKKTTESIERERALEYQVDKMLSAAKSAPMHEELGFDWPFPYTPELNRSSK